MMSEGSQDFLALAADYHLAPRPYASLSEWDDQVIACNGMYWVDNRPELALERIKHMLQAHKDEMPIHCAVDFLLIASGLTTDHEEFVQYINQAHRESLILNGYWTKRGLLDLQAYPKESVKLKLNYLKQTRKLIRQELPRVKQLEELEAEDLLIEINRRIKLEDEPDTFAERLSNALTTVEARDKEALKLTSLTPSTRRLPSTARSNATQTASAMSEGKVDGDGVGGPQDRP